jgi:hypothetical protein
MPWSGTVKVSLVTPSMAYTPGGGGAGRGRPVRERERVAWLR